MKLMNFSIAVFFFGVFPFLIVLLVHLICSWELERDQIIIVKEGRYLTVMNGDEVGLSVYEMLT